MVQIECARLFSIRQRAESQMIEGVDFIKLVAGEILIFLLTNYMICTKHKHTTGISKTVPMSAKNNPIY